MAIKTIDELDPVQAGYTVGENDVLPIAVENNGSYTTKKIKASALGGGGGGGAGVFIMHFTIGGSGFECEETIAEAHAAYQGGQYVVAEINTGADDEYMLASATYISDSHVDFLTVSIEGGALIRLYGDTSSGGTDAYQFKIAMIDWQDAN